MNIADIEGAVARIAQEPFDAETFAFDLFSAFGAPPATITRMRQGSQNFSDIPDGTLWRRQMHVLTCPGGQETMALERLAGSRATKAEKVRFLVATDGMQVAARDLVADDTRFFPFAKLGDNFGFFLPVAGYSRYQAAEENPVDVKASVRLKRLYDALIDENPEWAEPEQRHAMHLFMTRIIFAMFAEDTGIFAENQFSRTITEHGGHDGENMQRVLTLLFRVMNLPKDESRAGLPDWATQFEYVNGGLFRDEVPVPRFNRTAFNTLLDACRLRWNEINADIFGSMIQVIVDPDHRHETGLHYTSVPNILKALDPLFLNELRAEAQRPPLADASREKARLKALLTRLSKIRVFDPACGSGNFLVIAYQELRKIERMVLERLKSITGQAPGLWSHIELNNFFGIEISDFAAETAKLSLFIARIQSDQAHRDLFGTAPPALPLTDSGRIARENALRVDWLQVCPPPTIARNRHAVLDLSRVVEVHGTETAPDPEAETYIVGNPPYLGARLMSAEQKADLERTTSHVSTSWRVLDLVAGWVVKSSEYLRAVPNSASALVATNSICQGQQVGELWPYVLNGGVSIHFAHRSFKWQNNAAQSAAVICIIVGITTDPRPSRYLFDGEQMQVVESINPYLAAGQTIYVEARRASIGGLPEMLFGNMPRDDGNLILSADERATLLDAHPEAAKWIRRFVGSQEAIKGIMRYCLWIPDAEAPEAVAVAPIAKRLRAVAAFREASDAASTRAAATKPHRFVQVPGYSDAHSLVVPRVSSERREYLPVGYLSEREIVSDAAFALYNAPLWSLSLITSRLHLLWIETVCGKLKSDFRYSNTLGWNTFPVPPLSAADKDRLTKCAERILLARAEAGGTLAELYDPDNMPDSLKEAHQINDETLERIYTERPFRSDTDRLNHLFRRYARMIAAEKGIPVAPEFDFEGEAA